MEREVFTTVTLPSGRSAKIYEAYGVDYFKASSESKGDPGLFIRCLICRIVSINDIIITYSEVDSMSITDVSYISEVILTILEKPNFY